MSLGKAFRDIRGNRTLRDFAKLLDVSHAHLCNVENDKVDPSLALIYRCKMVTGVDPYLLAFAE